MTWIDRPRVHITRQDGRLTASLRNAEAFRYEAHEVEREPGAMEDVCPTIDHIIAAAGW